MKSFGRFHLDRRGYHSYGLGNRNNGLEGQRLRQNEPDYYSGLAEHQAYTSFTAQKDRRGEDGNLPGWESLLLQARHLSGEKKGERSNTKYGAWSRGERLATVGGSSGGGERLLVRHQSSDIGRNNQQRIGTRWMEAEQARRGERSWKKEYLSVERTGPGGKHERDVHEVNEEGWEGSGSRQKTAEASNHGRNNYTELEYTPVTNTLKVNCLHSSQLVINPSLPGQSLYFPTTKPNSTRQGSFKLSGSNTRQATPSGDRPYPISQCLCPEGREHPGALPSAVGPASVSSPSRSASGPQGSRNTGSRLQGVSSGAPGKHQRPRHGSAAPRVVRFASNVNDTQEKQRGGEPPWKSQDALQQERTAGFLQRRRPDVASWAPLDGARDAQHAGRRLNGLNFRSASESLVTSVAEDHFRHGPDLAPLPGSQDRVIRSTVVPSRGDRQPPGLEQPSTSGGRSVGGSRAGTTLSASRVMHELTEARVDSSRSAPSLTNRLNGSEKKPATVRTNGLDKDGRVGAEGAEEAEGAEGAGARPTIDTTKSEGAYLCGAWPPATRRDHAITTRANKTTRSTDCPRNCSTETTTYIDQSIDDEGEKREKEDEEFSGEQVLEWDDLEVAALGLDGESGAPEREQWISMEEDEGADDESLGESCSDVAGVTTPGETASSLSSPGDRSLEWDYAEYSQEDGSKHEWPSSEGRPDGIGDRPFADTIFSNQQGGDIDGKGSDRLTSQSNYTRQRNDSPIERSGLSLRGPSGTNRKYPSSWTSIFDCAVDTGNNGRIWQPQVRQPDKHEMNHLHHDYNIFKDFTGSKEEDSGEDSPYTPLLTGEDSSNQALSPPSPDADVMIGAAGSRHLSTRRRSSMASLGQTHSSLLSASMLGRFDERDEDVPRMRSVPRRRAVNTSDLRSCALVQSKMKTWKNYPE